MKEEIPNSGDTKFENSPETPLNEEEITRKLESYIKHQEDTNDSKKREEEKTSPHDEQTATHFSLFFLFSVSISLILGWVAGYFSLYNQFIFTFALVSMFIGGGFGFYFDQRINHNIKE